MGLLMAKQARSAVFITIMAFVSMGLAWVLRWLMLMGLNTFPNITSLQTLMSLR